MTELSSFSSFPNKKIEFSSNYLFSNLSNFCFSIFSHPIYFSYFLFFSPYLYKLLSFLSPLFITTTLLLLVALLTFTPNLVHEKGDSEFSDSKLDFLLSVFRISVSWLLSKADEHKDEEIGCLGEFEAYLVMFQASIFEVSGCEEEREDFVGSMEVPVVTSEENRAEKLDTVEEEATVPIIAQVKSLEALFQENAELEDNMSCQKEESEGKFPLRSESKVMGNNNIDKYAEKVKVKSQSQRLETNLGSPESNQTVCSNNLGSFGSMRVEKEWRRTLACKLFEERHNGDGSEGMDMLWETYERECDKGLKKSNTKKGKKTEDEYSEDEEEEMQGKLCCLQALKFSAGKMNLGMGMGRPNLVKFSKALKGIGWLHHVTSKHGKKGNHH